MYRQYISVLVFYIIFAVPYESQSQFYWSLFSLGPTEVKSFKADSSIRLLKKKESMMILNKHGASTSEETLRLIGYGNMIFIVDRHSILNLLNCGD